uniref:Ion transport domain-containing protein n=1 Tax=Hyaloperonospora arabidopsidis (strain Emoy2) TaxID=559515 RepID=M4B2F2_HYAAE
MSIIDLVVLIPFYLEILLEQEGAVSSRGVLTLRGFRLLRIMSFLHLERSYQAMKNLREIFALKKEELGVVSYLTIVIVLTSSTTM